GVRSLKVVGVVSVVALAMVTQFDSRSGALAFATTCTSTDCPAVVEKPVKVMARSVGLSRKVTPLGGSMSISRRSPLGVLSRVDTGAAGRKDAADEASGSRRYPSLPQPTATANDVTSNPRVKVAMNRYFIRQMDSSERADAKRTELVIQAIPIAPTTN